MRADQEWAASQPVFAGGEHGGRTDRSVTVPLFVAAKLPAVTPIGNVITPVLRAVRTFGGEVAISPQRASSTGACRKTVRTSPCFRQ